MRVIPGTPPAAVPEHRRHHRKPPPRTGRPRLGRPGPDRRPGRLLRGRRGQPAGTVRPGGRPFKVWWDSCTCPGADRARQRIAETGTELPAVQEIRERQEQDTQARRDAFQAASRAAAGTSRDEIRDLYLPELRSRGLAPPSERLHEATVERIAGNPIPSVRLVVEGLAQTAKVAVGLGRLLRDISRPPR